ncbi:LAGLIDADG family homing endonuclease [Paenibacillus macquariensis]|uniref:LAGLIDADG-like domain-containing protein n=1 Tax=Paenibacillus macquariensis TaxID=948756 RepID=A0ABY1JK78_9BACL|nr:LAGLIDADG family homing endonuclease [Paenibacillus macquariensis]MEC0089876.1 LAGLIDADG family homing endonuclease [Paenibacillus macquariensis]OAB30662.1 hypothetical protein PMSM_21160 [Paenibacillus macquariensis subsp. macquariensis]SIQ33291.1 LAGLIDADG-like domain-containing protein [Paenibacillus macquariensis]
MKNSYTDDQKIRICEIYSNTHRFNDALMLIEKVIGIKMGESALRTLVSRCGIKKSVTAFTKQSQLELVEIDALILDYESGSYTLSELCEKYGFKTRKSITDKVKMYGGRMRKVSESSRVHCQYDEDIFEELNEDWKAYFLGLLLTDGYVESKKGTVGLDLVDKETMRFLSEKTGKSITLCKERSNAQARHRILFTSRKMANDLKRLSVVNNKTHNLQKPKLKPSERIYLPHIIKGIIDGDGWIRKDGKEFFIVSASYTFLEWCKEVLESFGMFDLKITTMRMSKLNENWNDAYLIRTAIKHNIEILKETVYYYDIGMKIKRNRLFQQGDQRL